VKKKFYQVITEDKKYWSRECLRKFFSFDCEAFSEFYEDEIYQKQIKDRVEEFRSPDWRYILQCGLANQANFLNVLNRFTKEEEAKQLHQYFYDTLRLPGIPLPKLKRETIICNTQTLFQNKLSEVLFEDGMHMGNGFTFEDFNKKIMEQLLEREEEIIAQMTESEKKKLMQARWYILDPNDEDLLELSNGTGFNLADELKDDLPLLFKRNSSYRSNSSWKSHGSTYKTLLASPTFYNSSSPTEPSGPIHSILLLLYVVIYQAVSHHCQIVFEYLKSLDNVYDLLAEYTIRWNLYVGSMLELEQTFQPFCQLMNIVYERVYPFHPSHPKFSIWRFMTKVWMEQVYEKNYLSNCLNETFVRVLANHREKNVKESVNNNFSADDLFIQEENQIEQLPKNLFLSLKTKAKKNSIYQNVHTPFQVKNTGHPLFSASISHERKLLSRFLQSILDLSLNEVNIHYLDCTNIPTNNPYSTLESEFLKASNEFYNDHIRYFNDNPNYFCQFLKSDLSLLSEILTLRTNLKLEKIQVGNGFEFMKQFVVDHVRQNITPDALEDNKPTQNTPIPMELESFLNDVIVQIEDQGPCKEHSFDFFSPCAEVDSEELDDLPPELSMPSLSKSQSVQPPQVSVVNYEMSKQKLPPLPKTRKTHFKILDLIKSKYSNFDTNLSFLHERITQFDVVKEKDEELRRFNIDNNIPVELGDIDSLFYDFDKNIDCYLLDKMRLEYEQMVKQQSARNSIHNQHVIEIEEDHENVEIIQRNFNGRDHQDQAQRTNGRMRDVINEIVEPMEINIDDLDLMTLPLLRK
jgi:hypothetical protein